MKNNLIKTILFLALFAGFAANSFGETFYNSSLGYTRLYEQYNDDNFGRDLDGINFEAYLVNFSGRSPLGWYLKTSIGGYFSGTEWKDDTVALADIYSATDVRLSAGPSFTLRADSNLQVIISCGPVIANYREELNEYDYYDELYYDYDNVSGFFEAITVGALGDIGIVLTAFNRFTVITGIAVSYDFLRWEKGLNADMTYRSIHSGSFNEVNYNALKVSLYFGIGLCFENAKVN